MPTATASTTYTTTSSMTATDSTIWAKRVLSSPRSSMIREITGMLVTAIASAKTSSRAVRLWAVPSYRLKSIAVNAATPATNGSSSPIEAIHPTTRADDRLIRPRICVPAVNMRSRSPSW